MKKITGLLAVTILFTACKKERTCSCEITTSGSVNSHMVTNGLSFVIDGSSLGLPFPINFPPITLAASKDTNFTTPYSYNSTYSETYDKTSKRSIKRACPSSTEESVNKSYTTIVPGSYTVTSNEVGTESGKCSIK
ncbi:MAG: hypothetical protein JNL60_18355 [Bacteroidia bacterium]|nr:hypothetical protein [Bacteroidia bacterium]